jgi:PQQ-dependent catabolism-associated CXXCW motif protein
MRVRVLVWAALAAAASLVPATVSSTSHPAEPQGFWTGPINDPVPATLRGAQVIHTRGLAALLQRYQQQKATVVIVDVSNAPRRPESLPATSAWLPVPHQAIPGALWIPGAGLGSPPPTLERYYSERLAQATDHDLARPLVVYCHEKCWLSWNGAKRAVQYGYHQVYWYPDGIEGWRKARLPTAVVEPQPVP